ncbi:MAG TPA: outer membrane lipoprotein-sorting protein [Methylomirabilota bacterium]|nr:outer membrane lipoprotein-sorting protein [Methylomirabilota bacterium]
MSLKLTMAVGLAVVALSLPQTKSAPASVPTLTAEQIVARNAEARGGLPAWRAVRTLSLSGKMEAGGNDQPGLRSPKIPAGKGQTVSLRPSQQIQLPFRLEMERGGKSRLELDFRGQTAVQVYDGAQGWKLRPYLNRHDVEPYTADEMSAVASQSDLDGPLVDYAAKGTKIELDGVEKVEGNECYRLRITLKNGHTQRVWINAQTFLEAKIDGAPRRLDGKFHNVEVYYRDYRKVDGLTMPYLTESKTEDVKQTERIIVDKIVVNPPLAADQFAKPK